jgi:hypothetical protein
MEQIFFLLVWTKVSQKTKKKRKKTEKNF